MAPAIHFRDAVALAGRFPLLAGVDLEVGEGEVVHLRGPNGAGKTSLLRAVAGLVPITRGRAEVLGHDLTAERREVRRQVGLLGHATFLYEELTVEDNLRFAARAARAPAGSASAALQRLGLPARLQGVRVGQLSAGQRRRVALAALLARSPRLWLLDEPHAGLDEAAREVLDELVGDVRAAGATVLLASHEVERAALLADRTVTIAGGRIVAPEPELPEPEAGVRTAAAGGPAPAVVASVPPAGTGGAEREVARAV